MLIIRSHPFQLLNMNRQTEVENARAEGARSYTAQVRPVHVMYLKKQI